MNTQIQTLKCGWHVLGGREHEGTAVDTVQSDAQRGGAHRWAGHQ